MVRSGHKQKFEIDLSHTFVTFLKYILAPCLNFLYFLANGSGEGKFNILSGGVSHNQSL